MIRKVARVGGESWCEVRYFWGAGGRAKAEDRQQQIVGAGGEGEEEDIFCMQGLRKVWSMRWRSLWKLSSFGGCA